MTEKNKACEGKALICLQRPYEVTQRLSPNKSDFLQCVLYQVFGMAVS